MTGDSITHGLLHTRGARNYVEHLHELIRGDMGRVQDAVINTAISGWRIPLILDDFERRVATWRPDVVTLMIGTNDCSTVWVDPIVSPSVFGEDVATFVVRVRALGAIPVLQTPPFIDQLHAPDRSRIGEFASAIREVAAREHAILVDQDALFAGSRPGRVRATRACRGDCSTMRSTRTRQDMRQSRSSWRGCSGSALWPTLGC